MQSGYRWKAIQATVTVAPTITMGKSRNLVDRANRYSQLCWERQLRAWKLGWELQAFGPARGGGGEVDLTK